MISNRWSVAVRLVWVTGFLVGTVTHVHDLLLAGTDVYVGYPSSVRLFWVSLTLIDPITAALLARRRRAGVALGLAVMLADIVVNWSVRVVTGDISLSALVCQTVFAVFLVATARLLWRTSPRRVRP